MMKKLSGLFAVLVAVGIIAAAAFFASTNGDTGRGAITLWYVEGDALAEALRECTDEYNSAPERKGLPVEFRPFADEEELAAAFETSSPDMLLCTHMRAFSLYERGNLTDISADIHCSPRYSKSVSGRNASIGKSFFPIGLDLPVLVINHSLCKKTSFESIESLFTGGDAYASDTGKPFFGCDSFSKLFALTMLRYGKEFGADFENESGKQYIDLYNLFARAVFDGSMYPVCGNMARYVSGGALPCAVVDSSSLVGLSLEGLGVTDVPVPADFAARDTLGTAVGLAITNGGSRSTADIGAFVSWLAENGKGVECAQKNALASAEIVSVPPSDELSQTLSEIAESGIVSLSAPSSDYAANSDKFDSLFSEAMRKLH